MRGTSAYDAFVSYSHSADAKLAPALRLALHKFAKPWYKTRALSVFLDQSSLSANPALWAAIERALSTAKHFILLASPESAASPWVRKEIDWWLRRRSVDSMLILLTGGELAWDGDAGDFDWTRTTSIARELAGRFPTEPLYVDLRAVKADGALSLRDQRFRGAVLNVAAPLHGRNKDELDGEDIIQNRRTMRIARGVAMVMALLAAAAVWQAIVANQQRNEAIAQRGVAERETARAQTQEGIANEQRDIAQQKTIEAQRQEKIATEQRDEAVRQRDLALSRRLLSDSSRQLVNPLQWNLAMLLAIESMRKAPTADNYELLSRLSRDGARVVAAFPGDRVVFNPSGRLVATREEDHLVVREARGGRVRARVDANGISLASICFTPAGDRVVGYFDELLLVDIDAQRRLRLPVEIERGSALSASPDCRFLSTARAGRGVLIDLEATSVAGEFAIPEEVTALSTSNDGQVAYAQGARVTVAIPRTKAIRSQFQVEVNVTAMSFDPDGKRLAVSIGAKGVVMVDADTGRPISTSAARGLLTSDRELSAGYESERSELVFWKVPQATWTKRITLPATPTTLEWSGDGEFFAFAGGEGEGAARVLQSESWRQLAKFAFSFPGDTLMQTPPVFAHVSPSGDLASASDHNRAVVFEIHQDRPVVTLPPTFRPGPVALSADGKRVAFRTADQSVAVLDTTTGRELASFECKSVALRPPMQMSASGRVVAVVCGGESVVVYDVNARRQLANLPLNFASPMAMSRDGTHVFAGRVVVRTATAKPVRDVRGGRAAALDPRGQRVALADGSQITLFDLQSGAPPRRIDAAINALESVAFSDDGTLLAAGGRDMRVKIFDAAAGQMLQLLEHIEQNQWLFRIHRLAFSPSGRLIVTLADDPTIVDLGRPGTVRVFEVGTGREVARIPFPELAHDVRFSADDSALEIAVGRRRIRWERYPLAPADMIAKSCRLVQRNMEAIEWARFMGDALRRDTCPAAAP